MFFKVLDFKGKIVRLGTIKLKIGVREELKVAFKKWERKPKTKKRKRGVGGFFIFLKKINLIILFYLVSNSSSL